jgi:hypothetical protein
VVSAVICPSPVTSVDGLDDIFPQVFNFFDADTSADEVGNHSGGDWGFLIEVIASNMDALGDAILDSLSQLEGGGGRTHIMVSFYDFEGWS